MHVRHRAQTDDSWIRNARPVTTEVLNSRYGRDVIEAGICMRKTCRVLPYKMQTRMLEQVPTPILVHFPLVPRSAFSPSLIRREQVGGNDRVTQRSHLVGKKRFGAADIEDVTAWFCELLKDERVLGDSF